MKMLATALAAVLYGIGWVAGIIAAGCAWLWSAVAVGYDDARTLARRGHAPASQPALRAVPTSPVEGVG